MLQIPLNSKRSDSFFLPSSLAPRYSNKLCDQEIKHYFFKLYSTALAIYFKPLSYFGNI